MGFSCFPAHFLVGRPTARHAGSMRNKLHTLLVAFIVLAVVSFVTAAANFKSIKRPGIIGATAGITELNSGIAIKARVDTGARMTSLHCGDGDLEIIDASLTAEENIGKSARLRVANDAGEAIWIDTYIDSYTEVRNSEHAELRYCVVLPLSYHGYEQPTLVSLNDRSTMSQRMLLGRNFLSGNFVVDVTLNSTDVH